MQNLAPVGAVYQAGTLSGNPVAVAAGLKTLELLAAPGFFDRLSTTTTALMQGMVERAHAHHIPFNADSEGGMFGMYFSENIPTCLTDVSSSNIAMFNRFFHLMLDQGIYLAPSAYEAGFVSAMHDDQIIQTTLDAADHAFKQLKTNT
jgi:glutamate-1-semialdehyde 2,1-aminomutase